MLASTAPGRRVPKPFRAVTSAAVSGGIAARSSSLRQHYPRPRGRGTAAVGSPP